MIAIEKDGGIAVWDQHSRLFAERSGDGWLITGLMSGVRVHVFLADHDIHALMLGEAPDIRDIASTALAVADQHVTFTVGF